MAAFRSGDNRQAIEWAERALQSAEMALAETSSVDGQTRARRRPRLIAHATNTIGVALARSGQFDAARERIERSLTAARERGLLEVACRAYANLGVLYSTVEPKRAIDVSLAGLELAAKIGAALAPVVPLCEPGGGILCPHGSSAKQRVFRRRRRRPNSTANSGSSITSPFRSS